MVVVVDEGGHEQITSKKKELQSCVVSAYKGFNTSPIPHCYSMMVQAILLSVNPVASPTKLGACIWGGACIWERRFFLDQVLACNRVSKQWYGGA